MKSFGSVLVFSYISQATAYGDEVYLLRMNGSRKRLDAFLSEHDCRYDASN